MLVAWRGSPSCTPLLMAHVRKRSCQLLYQSCNNLYLRYEYWYRTVSVSGITVSVSVCCIHIIFFLPQLPPSAVGNLKPHQQESIQAISLQPLATSLPPPIDRTDNKGCDYNPTNRYCISISICIVSVSVSVRFGISIVPHQYQYLHTNRKPWSIHCDVKVDGIQCGKMCQGDEPSLAIRSKATHKSASKCAAIPSHASRTHACAYTRAHAHTHARTNTCTFLPRTSRTGAAC